MNAPTGSDPNRSDRAEPQPPRGEAPAWAPLAGLAGLVLMLLFTGWYINTEPAPRWPDAAIRDARPERDVAAADASVDGSASDAEPDGSSDRGVAVDGPAP